MESALSFLIGLLLGIVAAFIAFLKLTESSREIFGPAKNDPKTRGDWGEVVLERILEASGLQEGVHYLRQESYKGENDELLRPDVVIYLPNNRHIIIDSKVSFDKGKVRERVKGLKNRFYDRIKELNTLDFVIMFVPVESVFAGLMKKESNILEFGWKNNVLITGPSTLLATLKTIERCWQQHNRERNAAEIAEESGKLYDKFVGFITDFDAVRNRLEDMNKKLGGRDGLVRQAEKIRELGAKTSKQMPG